MLSQATFANSTHLRRTKSTTSVKERRRHPILSERPDPEISRVHALIAAHRAMDRSHERSSGDLDRSDSNTSRRTVRVTKSPNVRFSPATQLRRQRSLLQSKPPSITSSSYTPFEHQYNDECTYGAASEFGGTAESYGAEPSSYRRLRRARSLLTPHRRGASGSNTTGHTPFSQAKTLRSAVSTMALNEPSVRLRLKRSLTFLRPAGRTTVHPRPETELGHRNEALQLARDQFFNDQANITLQKRPSLLFHPNKRREQKAFRKSVRTSQLQNAQSSISLDCQTLTAASLDENKRSFSASIRDRVKKAFGRSLTNNSKIPPQHLEATRAHFNDGYEQIDPTNSFDSYYVNLQDPKVRDSLYIPSNKEGDSYEDLDKISQTLRASASRESLHSNSRSRVTSWTNSTATSSIVQRGTPVERNRLSIIKEDGGPHQPSSSAGRHLGGVNVVQEPLRTGHSNGPICTPIDSRRIYSALMRRIGEEEAEMERTQAELDQIHKEHERIGGAESSARPTIRAVSSENSIRTATRNKRSHHSSMETGDKPGTSFSMTVKQHQQNVERRKEKIAMQEEQSSFFPFSSERNPRTTPSPFKKLLEARRSQGLTDESNDRSSNAASVVRHEQMETGGLGLSQGRIGMSSESIYSRTTQGGVNSQYNTPVGSSEEVCTTKCTAAMDTGMATIISTPHRAASQRRPPLQLPQGAGAPDRAEWKGWLEGQMANLHRNNSKASSHFREHAQIDPEDVEVGDSRRPKTSHGGVDRTLGVDQWHTDPRQFKHGRTVQQSTSTNRFPLLDLKEVPRNNTPVPKRSGSLTKSQSGLLKQPSLTRLSLGQNDENRNLSGGFRKISPGNIARMLREKKGPMLPQRQDDTNKENKTAIQDDSPPMSTPGRLRLQMRSGNGRLRKQASEMALGSRKGEQTTPTDNGRLYHFDAEDIERSPSDRIRKSLAARLSRPFNMDVPEHNRPFDSTYLGKREGGVGGFGGLGRLSVATPAMGRGPKGYGGLGVSRVDADGANCEDKDETALPRVPTPSSGTSKTHGLWNSKRMVSNFLKSRRMGRSVSESGESIKERGAAFV